MYVPRRIEARFLSLLPAREIARFCSSLRYLRTAILRNADALWLPLSPVTEMDLFGSGVQPRNQAEAEPSERMVVSQLREYTVGDMQRRCG